MNTKDKVKTMIPTLGKNIPQVWKNNLTFKTFERVNFLTPIVLKYAFIQNIVTKIPFVFKPKNEEFLIVDYLILGNNPLLNFHLIKRILGKAKENKTKVTVAFLNQDYFDYWGYHFFKQYDQELDSVLNELYLLESEWLDIISISENVEMAYFKKFDDHYCSFFAPSKKDGRNQHFIEAKMPIVSNSVKNIKSSILHEFYKKFKTFDNYFTLKFSKEKTSHVISRHIFSTCLQKNLNYTTTNSKEHYESKAIDIINFEHELSSTSFGSALHVPHDFSCLDEIAFADIDRVKNFPMESL